MRESGRESRKNTGGVLRGCRLGFFLFFLMVFWALPWSGDFHRKAPEGKKAEFAGGLVPVEAWAGQAQWVFDEGGLLSLSQEQQLEEKAEMLFQDTGYNFFVVTLEDAGGKTSREAAEDFYIEHQTVQDGAVYLIDMDNRELYLATSGEMRYVLNDKRWKRALDAGYEFVADENYGEAFLAMLEQTEEYLEEGIEAGTFLVDEDTGKMTYYEKRKKLGIPQILAALGAAFLAGAGAFAGVKRSYRKKSPKETRESQQSVELDLTEKEDVFVNCLVTRRHIPRNPPEDGEHGGSSTVHSGSGGSSFGGGGRKF